MKGDDMRCDRCGFWVVTGEEHTCQRRAAPDIAAHYATLARTAARAGATVARARTHNEHEETP